LYVFKATLSFCHFSFKLTACSASSSGDMHVLFLTEPSVLLGSIYTVTMQYFI